VKRKRSLFVFAILLLALGLLTVSVAFAESGVGLRTNSNPIAGPINQASAIATGGSITITHSTSQVITTGNSVSCNAGGLHAENSYYRVFDLDTDFGIVNTFDVTAVQYGIETATGSGGTQPVSVKLYTLNGVLNTANLTPIGNTTDNVPNQTGTIFTSLVNGSVPAGGVLVVEILTPDGQTAGNSFFIGSNAAGQTDPGYLRAPDCGVAQPTATGSIGFPNMHIVLNVIGNEAGGVPAIVMTKTVGTDPGACATTSNISVGYGSTVYYCYTVTNTGNVTLTGHTLTDDVLGTVLGPDFAYNLVPGASAYITASYVLTGTSVTNTALWEASINSTVVATATASATVTGTPTDVTISGVGGQTTSNGVVLAAAMVVIFVMGAALYLRRQHS